MRAFGLNFPNPIGLAAGFDKNAEVPDALLRLGFGFVEVGTVTPRPQAGNPKPRVFRLAADEAIDQPARLQQRRRAGGAGAAGRARRRGRHRRRQYRRQPRFGRPRRGLCAADRDLRRRRKLFHRQRVVAEYAGPARSAAGQGARRSVGARDRRARARAPRAGPTPVLVKIAPDLTLPDLDDVVGIARKHRVDGMIVSNTTISRPGSLRARDKAKEAGGLSGRPLFKLSTRMLAETFVRAEGQFPLIGVGGIDFERHRHRQDQGRRHAGAALHWAGLSRHRAGVGDEDRHRGRDQAGQSRFARLDDRLRRRRNHGR